MATFSFNLRPSVKIGMHEGSLFIRIIHGRKVGVINTAYKVYPQEWDKLEHCLVFSTIDYSRIQYLRDIENKMRNDSFLLQQTISLLEKGGSYSIKDIINLYQKSNNENLMSNYVGELAIDLVKAGQERTARAYHTVSRALASFNQGQDVPLEYINNCLLKDFESYLITRGKSPNTISFYIRNIRAIYNKAIKDKRIEPQRDNPFSSVYTGVQVTRKKALNVKEVNLLNRLDLIQKDKSLKLHGVFDESLYFAQRLFFFCFHARGMSFVDMAFLQKKNIRNGILTYFRKKTGQLIEVKVTSAMQKIIDSFADDVKGSSYLFPIIKDETKSKRLQYESALRIQNKRLKRLAILVGLKKEITTHVARHSWATIAKHQNLPLWVISEGLGHSTQKMTYTYLASFERSVLDQANESISTMIGAEI